MCVIVFIFNLNPKRNLSFTYPFPIKKYKLPIVLCAILIILISSSVFLLITNKKFETNLNYFYSFLMVNVCVPFHYFSSFHGKQYGFFSEGRAKQGPYGRIYQWQFVLHLSISRSNM